MKRIIFVIVFFLTVAFCFKESFGVITNAGGKYGSFAPYFAINAVHHKLYAISDTGILTFDLYPDSGCLVTPGDNPSNPAVPLQRVNLTVAGRYTMALDAMKKKLYVGTYNNTIHIFSISDTGMVIPSSTVYSDVPYSHSWTGSGLESMYVDFVNNLLVTSGWGNGGVVISRLGADGMPAQSAGDTYITGGGHNYVVSADLARGILYTGHWVTTGSWVKLSNGYPVSGTYGSNGLYGSFVGMELDSANKRIYWPYSYVSMWRLNDGGTLDTYDTFGTDIRMLCLDPVRRKLFAGGSWTDPHNHVAFYNLDNDGKISSFIDSGLYAASGGLSAIAYEPFYNKIYASIDPNGTVLLTYNGPDSPLVPVKINNAESYTQTQYVTLKFQHSNPNFMYVSGDILSIGNPVNTVNQWLSCGGNFWMNPGDTMRAGTLTVPVILSSGVGEKTIEVWYCGQTMYSGTVNFTAMMRKATAKITLIESVANVSLISLSGIDYDGGRIDYVVKDSRERNVNVEVQYRTKDRDWTTATTDSWGEGLTNLKTDTVGVSHYYGWDIEKDLPEDAEEVQVRIRANNGDSEGAWTETQKYSVPDWTGSDLRAVNVSIRKPPGNNVTEWMYRIRLDWTGVDDTSVDYELQKKEDDGSWVWIGTTTGTVAEIENLSDIPIYSFRARIRTRAGLFSSFSKTAQIRLTARQYGTGTLGKTGGMVFIEDFDGNEENNSRVEVDNNTFNEDVYVTLEKYQAGTYEIKGRKSNGVYIVQNDFKKAVTLKLAYDKEDVGKKGWKEEDLAVYHFDGRNWNSIGGKVDRTNALVTVKVSHFSLFKVAKNSEKQTISVVPDYLSPNNDGIADVLYFYFTSQNMVEKAVISVYDITGKTIRIIKADGSNTLLWDGRNGNGELCETGLYVVVIEADNQKMTETIRLVK